MMLRSQRYTTAKDFQPFIQASALGYLLGTTFQTKHALAEALEAVDPHTQPWGRTRLAYQIDEARRELLGDDDEATGSRWWARCAWKAVRRRPTPRPPPPGT